ncbi:hypothetical protein LSTR_LSTR009076 [Laodelphax striatellus]|uniref:Uncharacterized protein n=1 Tax=Laodelphax striatellus TaxID=195883 RepID=A0A482XGE1_LAOST|nr:hypothetical protein LSTR_LSTR016767 [Laodelphax striatellus]RZF47540.1 hypothetical protein LSTR_LSTR009076 [Laodelphax striatellus]
MKRKHALHDRLARQQKRVAAHNILQSQPKTELEVCVEIYSQMGWHLMLHTNTSSHKYIFTRTHTHATVSNVHRATSHR